VGQSVAFSSSRLSQTALDALCRQLLEAAEFMSDEQVLCVADSLHDTLRHRRQARCSRRRHAGDRLCASGGQAFPF